MEKLTGIGKLDRERLAALLRGTKGTVSVAQAAKILGVANTDAAKMLSRWHKKGWLSRIKRGLYVPIPMEATTSDVPLEDPWLIAATLYAPCYIGGWSAAEHWDLTEQIFRTTVVMTRQSPRDRNPVIKGTPFVLLHHQRKEDVRPQVRMARAGQGFGLRCYPHHSGHAGRAAAGGRDQVCPGHAGKLSSLGVKGPRTVDRLRRPTGKRRRVQTPGISSGAKHAR